MWNNKDLTFGQKLTSTLTSLGMIIPMFTRAFGPESMAKIAAFGNLINGRTAADNAVNPAIKAVRTMSETGKTLETAAAGSAEAMDENRAGEKIRPLEKIILIYRMISSILFL